MIAVGGNLSIEWLLLAYYNGIFPWYNDNEPILWWCPQQRMVMELTDNDPGHGVYVSKTMRQFLRRHKYDIRLNSDFGQVMHQCATTPRGDHHGTWLDDEMQYAYMQLHRLGYAQSVEIYEGETLVGGLYGVDLEDAGIFVGESMFSHRPNVSKLALIVAAGMFQRKGYKWIDCQLPTNHLQSMGGKLLSREDYLAHLIGT